MGFKQDSIALDAQFQELDSFRQSLETYPCKTPRGSNYRGVIEGVVAKPEVVFEGRRGKRKAIRYLNKTHLGPKYLVVVYIEHKGEKAIITAYFTSNVEKVKGEIVWRA